MYAEMLTPEERTAREIAFAMNAAEFSSAETIKHLTGRSADDAALKDVVVYGTPEQLAEYIKAVAGSSLMGQCTFLDVAVDYLHATAPRVAKAHCEDIFDQSVALRNHDVAGAVAVSMIERADEELNKNDKHGFRLLQKVLEDGTHNEQYETLTMDWEVARLESAVTFTQRQQALALARKHLPRFGG